MEQDDKKNTKLSVVAHPSDFFKEAVTQAIGKQKISVDQNIEFYLVDLLTRFISADSLFVENSEGGKREEVLALRLAEAMGENDPILRQRSLKRLGDVSLYTCGFFSDRLSKKIVDVDYYIGMGRTAYSNLATLGSDNNFRTVFQQLSQRFTNFVDVLTEVSSMLGPQTEKDILRLYDLWLKTGSERAEKSLKEVGIIPTQLIKPDWQQ